MILPSESDEGHSTSLLPFVVPSEIDPASSAVHQTKQGDLPFPLPLPPPAYSPRHPFPESPRDSEAAFADPTIPTLPIALHSAPIHPHAHHQYYYPIEVPKYLPAARTGLYAATFVWSILVIALSILEDNEFEPVPAIMAAGIHSLFLFPLHLLLHRRRVSLNQTKFSIPKRGIRAFFSRMVYFSRSLVVEFGVLFFLWCFYLGATSAISDNIGGSGYGAGPPLVAFGYIQWITIFSLIGLLLFSLHIERVNGRRLTWSMWKERWNVVPKEDTGDEFTKTPLMRQTSRRSASSRLD